MMFKKSLKILLISLILTINLAGLCLAAKTIEDSSIQFTKFSQPNANSKVILVNNLPNQPIPLIIANVIKMALGIAGALAFLSFTVGGIMLVIANGADDKVGKAKTIILWSIVALVIMAVSFAVVTGVTQLNFFTPQAAAPGGAGGAQGGAGAAGDGGANQGLAPGTSDLTKAEQQQMQQNNL